MGRKIPDEVIEKIRQHFDLVDVIGETVALKRSGRSYMGLCPFHSERTPSFYVSPEKQLFHCFGCGAGGNLFTFYMKMENTSFVEAVSYFAKRAGIPLPLEEEEPSAEALHRKKLYAANELAAKYYQHILLNSRVGKKALEYLIKRGLTYSTIEHFQLGFAPGARDVLLTFLKKRGYPEDLQEEAGLVSKGPEGELYDRFRRRIMFPIHDLQGRVVGFGGRIIGEGEPKYLNSPETALFHKGRHLYNFHRARPSIRQTKQVILLEGYMDVITAYQTGIHHVVASLGTALTGEQIRLLQRNTEEIILMYDGDEAGQKATLRSLEAIRDHGGRAKVVLLPDGQDPDEFLQEHGKEALLKIMRDRALSDIAYKLQKLRSESQLSTQEGRLRFLRQAARMIAEISSPVEKETLLRELAGEFRVSLESLIKECETYSKGQKSPSNGDIHTRMWNTNRDHGNLQAGSVHRLPYPAHIEAERKLLSYMLIDEGAARQVREVLVDEFSVEEHAALAIHLYRFYGERGEANPALFISQLDDPEMIRLATELAMEAEGLEKLEQRPGLLQEYIECVRRYPLEKRLKQLPHEMEEALRKQDFDTLRALHREQLQLRSALR